LIAAIFDFDIDVFLTKKGAYGHSFAKAKCTTSSKDPQNAAGIETNIVPNYPETRATNLSVSTIILTENQDIID
jgi:hypothetical protein